MLMSKVPLESREFMADLKSDAANVDHPDVLEADGDAGRRFRSESEGLTPRIILIACLSLIAALGLLYPFPFHGLIWSELFNLAHAPAFALLLLAIIGCMDPRSVGLGCWGKSIRRFGGIEILAVATIVLVLGIAGEFAQKYSGRSASWGDVLANSCGLAAATMGVFACRQSGWRRGMLALAAVGLVAGVSITPLRRIAEGIRQRIQMPQLAAFEREGELVAWHPLNSTMELTNEWSSEASRSLRVQMYAAGFSGISFIWPVPNWQSYKHLSFDVQNPGKSDLALTLKILDEQHAASGYDPEDRFHKEIRVPAESQVHVLIDLENIERLPNGRKMDLAQIERLELFTAGLTQPAVFCLDNVRLEP